MRSQVRKLSSRLSYLQRTLRLVWDAAPRWTTGWAVLIALQGLLPAVTIYLTKQLVDSLGTVIGKGAAAAQIQQSLLLVGAVAALMVLGELLSSVTEWVRTAQSEYIQAHIIQLVERKSATVDLAFYETPAFFDRLDQVRLEASSRSLGLVESIGSVLQNAVTLAAVAAILIPYGVALPVVLFVSTLPAFLVLLRFNRRYHEWWQHTTADRRRGQYFEALLTSSMPAAEVRLFGLGEYFQQAHESLQSRLRGERLRLIGAQSLARLVAGASALIVAAVTLAWMVWRAVHGHLSLGDLALFYQAFSRGQGLLRSVLRDVGQIYGNSFFLESLFTFLDIQPTIHDVPDPLPMPDHVHHDLRFRDVTFRYPGSDRPALSGFNLTIPAGKIVAVVGMNGAGKSTLVKLLCRFYDPQEGAIEVDGVDIRQFAVDQLRRHITVLFQQPMHYQTSAAQNIAVGDIQQTPTDEWLQAAARSAGVHDLIADLPAGYDTHLGKWFADGVELSGGEWQRVAMARAFARQAPILVLDEPTSAMDSWAEADSFDRLRSLANERTGLIITHRFTIAMRADVIHVMEHGQFIESGTHAQLLALGGRYAQSWQAQMQASDPLAPQEPFDAVPPSGRDNVVPAAM